MKTHISILAHKEARETFKRHFPYWEKQVQDVSQDMLVFFPARSNFEVGGVPVMHIGQKEHHGTHAIARFRYILEHLNGLPYDRYIFHEYDSLSLDPIPEVDLGDIAGNFFDVGGDTGGFASPIFPHPPLVFSSAGLRKVVTEFRDMPWEQGVWDRWLGLIVHRSGMSHHSFLTAGTGFAMNTVEPDNHKMLRDAVRAGAVHLHGIKSPEAFQIAVQAHQERKKLIEAEAVRLQWSKE